MQQISKEETVLLNQNSNANLLKGLGTKYIRTKTLKELKLWTVVSLYDMIQLILHVANANQPRRIKSNLVVFHSSHSKIKQDNPKREGMLLVFVN